jgi:intracellular septation protein
MSDVKKTAAPPKCPPKWLPPMLDFGPLLLFFITNWWFASKAYPAAGPLAGTAVFMVAIIAALIISKWKLGKISPMMWMSAILVTGFGALTLWFQDPKFIQLKPTLIYLLFAAVLFAGLFRGKAFLQYLLEYAFEGVDHDGWMKLSRNWALFFIAMAGLNEVLRSYFDFDTWLTAKTWGVTIIFFLFNMSQIPMLVKHGLNLGDLDANKPD